MNILDIVAEAWRWKGLVPVSVIEQNAFGNLIVIDTAGKYWRICPEELSCKTIASSEDEYRSLRSTDEFDLDWAMARPVGIAVAALGPVPAGRCYCLKIPAVLGGPYDAENMGTVSVEELMSFAGDAARQIDDVPDGTPITFKIVD